MLKQVMEHSWKSTQEEDVGIENIGKNLSAVKFCITSMCSNNARCTFSALSALLTGCALQNSNIQWRIQAIFIGEADDFYKT
jgi:hypothetical protein